MFKVEYFPKNCKKCKKKLRDPKKKNETIKDIADTDI